MAQDESGAKSAASADNVGTSMAQLLDVLSDIGIKDVRLEPTTFDTMALVQADPENIVVWDSAAGTAHRKLPDGRPLTVRKSLSSLVNLQCTEVWEQLHREDAKSKELWPLTRNPAQPVFHEQWEGTIWIARKYLLLLPTPRYDPQAVASLAGSDLWERLPVHSCFFCTYEKGQSKTYELILLTGPTFGVFNKDRTSRPAVYVSPKNAGIPETVEVAEKTVKVVPLSAGDWFEYWATKRKSGVLSGQTYCLPIPMKLRELSPNEFVPEIPRGLGRRIYAACSLTSEMLGLIPQCTEYKLFTDGAKVANNLYWARVEPMNPEDRWLCSRTGREEKPPAGYTLVLDYGDRQEGIIQKIKESLGSQMSCDQITHSFIGQYLPGRAWLGAA